jgi:carbonic anhydrase/acetyltransferase-like protein (isoleucine patch superfamily)
MPIVHAFRGATPHLGRDVFLAETAVVIGEATLGDEASVWFQSVVRADVGWIRIGKRTNVQDLSMIHVTGGVANTEIGDDVTIGHRVVIHGCRVEDGCLIGIGAVILDGAVVGEGSVVGAGAVVTPGTKIPPRSLALGCPARVVRPATDEERQMGVEGARRYVELARAYRALRQET